MDGDIAPLPTLVERMAEESFPKESASGKAAPFQAGVRSGDAPAGRPAARVALSREDLDEFGRAVAEAYARLAEKYYLAPSEPTVTQRSGSIQIKIDLVDEDR